jgi:hypothetical protein
MEHAYQEEKQDFDSSSSTFFVTLPPFSCRVFEILLPSFKY